METTAILIQSPARVPRKQRASRILSLPSTGKLSCKPPTQLLNVLNLHKIFSVTLRRFTADPLQLSVSVPSAMFFFFFFVFSYLHVKKPTLCFPTLPGSESLLRFCIPCPFLPPYRGWWCVCVGGGVGALLLKLGYPRKWESWFLSFSALSGFFCLL